MRKNFLLIFLYAHSLFLFSLSQFSAWKSSHISPLRSFTWQNTISAWRHRCWCCVDSSTLMNIFSHFTIPAHRTYFSDQNLSSLKCAEDEIFPSKLSVISLFSVIEYCPAAYCLINFHRLLLCSRWMSEEEVLAAGGELSRMWWNHTIGEMSRDFRSLLFTTEHSLLLVILCVRVKCSDTKKLFEFSQFPVERCRRFREFFRLFPQLIELRVNRVVIACLIASESLCGNLICIFHPLFCMGWEELAQQI